MLSRFTAFTTAGTAFGTVIAMPASTYLCEFLGWESVFYVFGSLGIVWFIIWSLVIHDGPDVHPRSVWLRQKGPVIVAKFVGYPLKRRGSWRRL